MISRPPFFVYALLLGGALAGCAGSPQPLVGEAGEAPMTPGVVVIGAPGDGSVTALDAAIPLFDASAASAPLGSGEGQPRPSDAAATAPADGAPAHSSLEDGGATEGGGPPDGGAPTAMGPPSTMGTPTTTGTPTTMDTPTEMGAPTTMGTPTEMGAPTTMGNSPADAGTVPSVNPEDAGTPPAVVDAGPPPVADAGRVGCLPGVYKGRFQGEISALLGLVRIDVAGDITIEVDLVGAPGDRLQIRNGLLQGMDTSEQRNPLFARISGVLNCATKQLENGTITDGTYNRVDPVWGGPPTTTTFTGTATAIYSDNPPSAAGTWQVQNDLGTRTSVGTWNAALQ